MEEIKLTTLAKCAGCGAKVGAGVLAKLLDGIKVHHDPNLLVGFDKSDDASVYRISDELALRLPWGRAAAILIPAPGKAAPADPPD